VPLWALAGAGEARVILLDYRARYSSLDTDKYLMWKDHGISVPASDGEVNETIAFGFTVAEFFRHLTDVVKDRPVLGHFHEWMGGGGGARIAHLKLPVATVFTTQRNAAGRYLASDDPEFYNHLPFLNPDYEAAKYGIYPRFASSGRRRTRQRCLRPSRRSQRTRRRSCWADGRVILPNGLNVHVFAALHEFQNLHRQYKERIHEFVMGHFFPSYSFDLDRTLYVFTSGRYEYRNKGMDLFVEAIWRLNERLKDMSDPPTVVAFIITRAPSATSMWASSKTSRCSRTCGTHATTYRSRRASGCSGRRSAADAAGAGIGS